MQVQWDTYKNDGSNEKSLMGGVSQSSSEPDAKISLTFTDEASKRLFQVTTDNVNHRIGILFDGNLITAPNIREPIINGDVEITGPTIKKLYAQEFVYRINKALGIETQEPTGESAPRSEYIGLISMALGLLIGGGAIKLISVGFPNILLEPARKSIGSSIAFLLTNAEMQKRLIFTAGMLVFIQLASGIPVPGLDASSLKEYMERAVYRFGGGQWPLQHMFMMKKMTIMSLELAPFFISCILLQISSGAIPALKQFYYQEKNGRQELTKHTYILTIFIVALQAYFISLWLESPNTWGGMFIVTSPGMPFRLLIVVTITAAVAVLFFVANLINRYGIGNGFAVIIVSYLVFKVLASLGVVFHLIRLGKVEPVVILILSALLVTLAFLAFCLTRYFAAVEIQNNKGNKVLIPLRPTIVGKEPLTLAAAISLLPLTIASFIHSHSLFLFFRGMEYGTIFNLITVIVLTIFLVYIYAVIVFDLRDIVGSVTKHGYSLTNNPTNGVDYLDKVMTKVLVWAGFVLVFTTAFPLLMMMLLKIPYSPANLFSAGILLVIVGVFSDIISQIGFFKDKFESGIKEWAICYVAFDEIEATIKSNYLKDQGIPALVEPLRFTWGLPIRTIVDQYRLYVPVNKNKEARDLLIGRP